MEVGDIVTLEGVSKSESNTYTIDTDEGDTLLLSHPIATNCLFRVHKSQVNQSAPILKSSSERSLDFAIRHSRSLTFEELSELQAIVYFFFYARYLTSRQKKYVSDICGKQARDMYPEVEDAMEFIIANEGVLDSFNRLWYRNFEKLFSGKQRITSEKQKQSIYNMAGFILAELSPPKTNL